MKPLHGTSLSKGTRDPDCVFILTTQYSRWLLLALRWVSVLALEEIVFGLSCFQIKKAARICILIPPLRKSYHKLNVSVLVLFEISGSLGNITAEWIMDFIKVQGSFTGFDRPTAELSEHNPCQCNCSKDVFYGISVRVHKNLAQEFFPPKFSLEIQSLIASVDDPVCVKTMTDSLRCWTLVVACFVREAVSISWKCQRDVALKSNPEWLWTLWSVVSMSASVSVLLQSTHFSLKLLN